MIDLSQKLITSLIFCSLVCGICLGAAYELVRFVRCMLNPTCQRANGVRSAIIHSVVFFSDLLFIIVFAICGILITFEMCGGVFRGVVYVGMSAGFFIYRLTVGRVISLIVARLAVIVKAVILWMVGILILPLRAIKFLIVKLYALTMGKIIGRIKERILLNRLAGLFDGDGDGEKVFLPVSEEPCEKGYRKEGRISFGGKKEA